MPSADHDFFGVPDAIHRSPRFHTFLGDEVILSTHAQQRDCSNHALEAMHFFLRYLPGPQWACFPQLPVRFACVMQAWAPALQCSSAPPSTRTISGLSVGVSQASWLRKNSTNVTAPERVRCILAADILLSFFHEPVGFFLSHGHGAWSAEQNHRVEPRKLRRHFVDPMMQKRFHEEGPSKAMTGEMNITLAKLVSKEEEDSSKVFNALLHPIAFRQLRRQAATELIVEKTRAASPLTCRGQIVEISACSLEQPAAQDIWMAIQDHRGL
mmetsp:Transcript_92672/g.164769  ORF Transcript_92672/g.164769 Transcript_92672/m.164769 type:complete len:269 (+) Transcript_92672:672-1478(+)